MKTFAAICRFVPDIMERRTPYREAHIQYVMDRRNEGRVMMAGPWEDPCDGALILFRATSREAVEAIIHDDPYFKAGLWPEIQIREWTVFMSSDDAYREATADCPGNTKEHTPQS